MKLYHVPQNIRQQQYVQMSAAEYRHHEKNNTRGYPQIEYEH